jgi:hypothetical protein
MQEAAYAILKMDMGSLKERPPLERGSCMILLEASSMFG